MPANVLSVGPEGLEPSPTWLRARHAATSTLIPIASVCRCAIRRGGNRTLDLILIRDLLSPLSYAPPYRAGGSRTLTLPLKRRLRCHYATALCRVTRMRLSRSRSIMLVLQSGSPGWSRTTAGDISDRHASVTPPDSREGRSRTDYLVLPTTMRTWCPAGRRSPSSRCFCFN